MNFSLIPFHLHRFECHITFIFVYFQCVCVGQWFKRFKCILILIIQNRISNLHTCLDRTDSFSYNLLMRIKFPIDVFWNWTFNVPLVYVPVDTSVRSFTHFNLDVRVCVYLFVFLYEIAKTTHTNANRSQSRHTRIKLQRLVSLFFSLFQQHTDTCCFTHTHTHTD